MNKPWRKNSLKDYSNEDLIYFLDHNEGTDLHELAAYISEILRRMNKASPLFPKHDKDWDHPITP